MPKKCDLGFNYSEDYLACTTNENVIKIQRIKCRQNHYGESGFYTSPMDRTGEILEPVYNFRTG